MSDNVIRTIKLNAYWPKEKEEIELLNNSFYITSRICNFCMTELWFNLHNQRKLFYERNGREPDFKSSKDKKEIENVYLYRLVRERFKEINAGNVSSLIRFVEKKFWNEVREYLIGKRSIPNFRSNSVFVRGDLFTIKREEDKIFLYAGIASKELKTRRIKCELKTKKLDGSQRLMLNSIISEDKKLKLKDMKVVRDKKGRLSFNIPCEVPKKKVESGKDRILGIDLGVTQSYYCAVSDIKYDLKLCPNDSFMIKKHRDHIRRQRREVQNRYSKFGKRVGKGREYALKSVERLSDKERNFVNTTYHNYSRHIIDIALKYGCSTIQMENLIGLKHDEKTRSLFGWAIGDLQEKIKYKAAEYDIKIKLVNPKYTSKRCHKCGFIHKDNRKDQSTFCCMNCGYKGNADFNAAKNLAIDKIDDIIENTDKVGY